MIIHSSKSRGHANHGWLESYHTFSFAAYYDPGRMGFGALRVINDDTVQGGMGFGTHGHKDMEIISIPLEGALSHKDSEGHSSIIRKGEVQIMSAGTGIYHSEFNASATELVKFLQIWVFPEKNGLPPRYEQKLFSEKDRKNNWQLVVSPDGREGSVTIHQRAFFSLSELESGKNLSYKTYHENNGVYLLVLRGAVEVNQQVLSTKDGAAINDVKELEITAINESEILLMEVPF